jgi:hypothetical protein
VSMPAPRPATTPRSVAARTSGRRTRSSSASSRASIPSTSTATPPRPIRSRALTIPIAFPTTRTARRS